MSPSVDLKDTAHRPWPLPRRPWVMRMTWSDLAFLHWPVAPAFLRSRIPEVLELDTFDGQAWLGIVPFSMRNVGPRWLPGIPGHTDFPEINLRTYVRHGDKAGVWFFSLDVTSGLAVSMARRFFHLPYFRARMMSQPEEGGGIHYASEREHEGAPKAAFDALYRPAGEVFRSEPGSIDEWLTERYCLYSANRRGRVFRGDIHHAPWPLQPAEVDIGQNAFTEQIKVPTPQGAPIAHFARKLDVVAWPLARVR